ncbi:membrane-bound lytic murein transglycosylase B [Nitrosospira multiformis]|uniref:Membrane-bound lytic murein transglycosylase B n=1 Tax=Nitrosospira multiformis TaxID=1231 RepID=A0A1I0ECM1_9PROT|nr:lytic murein transglycosylase B [Nitrosospira multiformis]SET42505.1 membrane-bound lytic murein transglycosylase B [Nitrosospira multiformis]
MRFLIYAFGFFALTGCVATTVAPPAAEPRPEIEGRIERKVEEGIERQVEGKIEEETKEEAKEGVKNFIGEMVERHGFVQAELEDILGQAQYQGGIIKAISQPATAKPWYAYRPVFVTPKRIAAGVAFWNTNAPELERARRDFGIPEEIIAAVIGVETFYGTQNGRHRILDALTTLAFNYPRRAAFFRGELEQYLLMGRDQQADLLNIRGSYAGAIGIPQFMPSSYRRYAVDFNNDGKIDLSGSAADAIGSVANYLKSYGWEAGQLIVVPAMVNGEDYREVLYSGYPPRYTVAEIGQWGVTPRWHAPAGRLATLLELEAKNGKEHWLAFNNFHVITRYNRSVNYAMSVLQLAEEIRAARASNL